MRGPCLPAQGKHLVSCAEWGAPVSGLAGIHHAANLLLINPQVGISDLITSTPGSALHAGIRHVTMHG
jgi:hypothetical protein